MKQLVTLMMMMVLMAVMLSATGFGADTTLYVCTTAGGAYLANGNDTTGNGTLATPYATIEKAIDSNLSLLGETVTIKVKDGDILAADNITFDTALVHEGFNFIIESYSGTGTWTFTYATAGSAAFLVLDATDIVSGTLTVRDMLLTTTETVGWRHADEGMDFTFEDCTITVSTAVAMFLDSADAGTSARDITLTRCTLTCAGRLFDSAVCDNVVLTDCTIVDSYETLAAASGIFEIDDFDNLTVTGGSVYNQSETTFLLGGTPDSITFDGVAFRQINDATGAPSMSGFVIRAVSLTGNPTFKMIDCTSPLAVTSGFISLPCDLSKTKIENNLINIYNDNDERMGIQLSTDDQAAGATVPSPYIANNVITFTGTKAGHGLLIGGDCHGAIVYNNTILQPTGGTSVAFVAKGAYPSVVNNYFCGDLGAWIKGGTYVVLENNTIEGTTSVVLQISKDTDSPINTVLTNNILYSNTGTWCLYAPQGHLSMKSDTNCYYRSDGGNLFKMTATEYAAKSDILTYWLAQTDTLHVDNDTGSLVINPQIDSNGYPQNRAVQRLGIGRMNYTEMGKGGGYRARYNN